ncbi:PD-(D/E)XK motif protein [bacterium]|nr:PD-(D/E)XK motif protein [bacterium]
MARELNLLQLFEKLPEVEEGQDSFFSCISIPSYSNYFLARTKENLPTLLIKSKGSESCPDIKLENIQVLFDKKCTYELNGKNKIGFFTITSLYNQTSLEKHFLDLLSFLIIQLGKKPIQEEVQTEIKKFIDLLRAVSNPAIKTIQGLWAELLLIEQSSNKSNFIKAWHLNTFDKLDFHLNNESIEVKSSSNRLRTHYFSIEQLHLPKKQLHYISSIFVEQVETGLSIKDLINSIERDNISDKEANKLYYITRKTLGSDYEKALTTYFDYELAKGSLQFFWHRDIPTINRKYIPRAIKEVKLKIDLTSVEETYNINEMRKQVDFLF